MRSRLFPLLVLGGLLLPRPALAQGIKSPAEVLPEKTIFYAEVRHPGELAKEVASLLEGSYLENVPESLAPLMKKIPLNRGRGPEEAGIFGLMLAPEVVNEIGRIQGAGIAITGLDKEARYEMPEYVVVVLPGESQAPSFVARLALTVSSYGYSRFDGKDEFTVRYGYERVEEVEGVGVYRMMKRMTTRKEGGKPETKQQLDHDVPAIAMLPQAVVFGNHKLVKDTIHRIKGKAEGKTLAGLESYQKALKNAPGKAGLFAFLNPAPLTDLLEGMELGREERQILTVAKKIINPKAFRSVAIHVTLEKGTLACRDIIELNPKEKSPLLELLPTIGIPRDLLAYVSPDSLAFAALATEGGAKRWKQLIALADDIAKEIGERDPLPSEFINGLEKAFEVDVATLLEKIKGVAISMPGFEHLMGSGGHPHGPPFTLLISAVDEKAADLLAVKTIPMLFTIMSRENVEPAVKKFKGHDLSVLETKRGYRLAYFRDGNRLLVSPEPTALVHGLEMAKKKGLTGDAKLAARLEAAEDPFAVAMTRPIQLSLGLVGLYNSISEINPELEDDFKVPGKGPGVKDPWGELKLLMELGKVEQPLLLTAVRAPEQITVDMTYPGLRPLVARIINLTLDLEFSRPGFGPGFGAKKKVEFKAK